MGIITSHHLHSTGELPNNQRTDYETAMCLYIGKP